MVSMNIDDVIEQMSNEKVLCKYCNYSGECRRIFQTPPCLDTYTEELEEIIDAQAYCEDNDIAYED